MKYIISFILVPVNEDALPGTVLIKLSVTDKDSEPSTVEYHIISGDILSQFSVRGTGEVFVNRALDREAIDKYELSVLATDGKFVAITILEIQILDNNGILYYFNFDLFK